MDGFGGHAYPDACLTPPLADHSQLAGRPLRTRNRTKMNTKRRSSHVGHIQQWTH